MIAALRSFFLCRRGAALVEFAVVAPLMIAIVLGIAQVGLYLGQRAAMERAASSTILLAAEIDGATLLGYEKDALKKAFALAAGLPIGSGHGIYLTEIVIDDTGVMHETEEWRLDSQAGAYGLPKSDLTAIAAQFEAGDRILVLEAARNAEGVGTLLPGLVRIETRRVLPALPRP